MTPTAPESKLLASLRQQRGATVSLPEIMAAFHRADPVSAASPSRRHILLEQLQRLETAGGIVIQKAGWDRTGTPALPGKIRLLRDVEEKPEGPVPANHPWCHELSFLVDAKYRAGMESWLALDAWLKTGGRHTAPAFVRERSWEIFHDDKALEDLEKTVPFRSGKIDLGTLKAEACCEPLAWEVCDMATQPVVLVIENPTTWRTVARWNTLAARYRAVVYGRGNSFVKAVADLERLRECVKFEKIEYFGDIDIAGLDIPREASAVALALFGRGLTPANDFYASLCAVPEAWWPESCDKRTPDPAAVEWLAPGQRAVAWKVLSTGRRLPQEAVSLAVLEKLTPAS